MQQLITPRQNLLGLFPDLPSAEAAVKALQEAGFAADSLTIAPQTLQTNSPVSETEAARGAGGGAVAGTVFGIMAGMLLGFMGMISPEIPQASATQMFVGVSLAGAGIGAFGGSLLGALSGVKLNTSAVDTTGSKSSEPEYIVLAEQATPEEVARAQELLKQFGSKLS